MKILLPGALAIAALLATGPAIAHGLTKPQHGGLVAMSGETLFELVAKPGSTQLYVIDDDEPVTATAMTAKLTVNIASKTRNIDLKPAGGNRFDGPALGVKPGAKVGVMVVDKTSQAHLGGTFIIK